MDGRDAAHLPGVLASAAVRNHVVRVRRPAVLDASHPGLEPWHAHGTGHHTHRDEWDDHAAARRCEPRRGRL